MGSPIISQKERIRKLEAENEQLHEQLAKTEAITDYIAVCDYPEVFDGGEEEHVNE